MDPALGSGPRGPTPVARGGGESHGDKERGSGESGLAQGPGTPEVRPSSDATGTAGSGRVAW